MADDARAAWIQQRREAITGHAAAFEAARAAEARQAHEFLDDFVRQAAERGLRPVPLVARALNGRARYRTRLLGWYLKSNRSVAVGEDGGFYVLEVPTSWSARIRGASVEPREPRLVIGAGAGDGESMPLERLLRQRLDAGANWP